MLPSDDVRTLARLWQLQNKMEAVGAAGAYDVRAERVAAARATVEGRLCKRLELLDGFARIVNMIEIEARGCSPLHYIFAVVQVSLLDGGFGMTSSSSGKLQMLDVTSVRAQLHGR